MSAIRSTLLSCLIASALSAGAYAADPLKAAFVYIGPTGDHGWTYSHDQGRKALEADAKIQTTFVENVPETADAERVFRDLAQKGYKVIFGTSFGYMNQMQRWRAPSPTPCSCTLPVTRRRPTWVFTMPVLTKAPTCWAWWPAR